MLYLITLNLILIKLFCIIELEVYKKKKKQPKQYGNETGYEIRDGS